MLILTRWPKERIYINDDIILTVEWVHKNGDIKFSLEAPENTKISLQTPKSCVELPPETVDNPVCKPTIKYKQPLSRLLSRLCPKGFQQE